MGNVIKFQKEYLNNKENEEIRKSISKNGIEKACFNKTLEESLKYRFNLQIPEMKTYNQNNSYECNIYAFLRMIKSIMKKDNSINTKGLDLSATYIDFYDKLEKINTFYNEILKENEITLEMINEKADKYVVIAGTFNSCKKIINKYGFVLSKHMNESSNIPYYNANLMIELLKNKVKSDATILIDRNGENDEVIKEILMAETYEFLSRILGNPPTKIEYKDELLTPLEFRKKYLRTSLNEYVTITPYDKDLLSSSYSFIPSMYLKNNEEIITLSVKDMKNVVIKQLKDGIGVWFSSEESTTLDYESGILDDNVFKYNELLNIKQIPNDYKITLNQINYDHAMCITGALIKDKEIKQFKVDNSFGTCGKHKGHLIMTDSFFNNCIITIIINKKYLNI